MSVEQPKFDAKGMPFRRLGSSGLRVPVFSLGGWLSLGGPPDGSAAGDLAKGKEIIKTAFDNGINMFDTAEGYSKGQSELDMGRIIKELNLRRSDLVISTKLYWGPGEGPNDSGLSRKHIIEGSKGCLQRLQLDYVDVIFAHRPDVTVPMVEIVRAFNHVIEQGWAFYWATSEWSVYQIEEAHHIADKLNLIAPIAEQCKHHMLSRERPEKEYEPLYRKYGMGTTVWSALAQGFLTGKYNDGIPPGSRLDIESHSSVDGPRAHLASAQGQADIAKVRQLTTFAEQELGCTMTHLALAWIAVNPNTSTVILGASKPEQILDNLKALEVMPKLTPEVLEKIEDILQTKPARVHHFGRYPLKSHLPST